MCKTFYLKQLTSVCIYIVISLVHNESIPAYCVKFIPFYHPFPLFPLYSASIKRMVVNCLITRNSSGNIYGSGIIYLKSEFSTQRFRTHELEYYNCYFDN